MDPYDPARWHDFFLATSGAAAALAGLLFVAISLHMRYIATAPKYRDVARGSIIGLMTALILSLLVLVSQPPEWLGVEYVIAGIGYVVLVGAYQLFSLTGIGWRLPRESASRSVVAYLMGLVGAASGIGMTAKIGPGLYVTGLIAVSR